MRPLTNVDHEKEVSLIAEHTTTVNGAKDFCGHGLQSPQAYSTAFPNDTHCALCMQA